MESTDEVTMGDYQVFVTWAIGWEGTEEWKSYPFFKTSLHAAKVETSALIKFRFQKDEKLCELVDNGKWDKESNTQWSKSSPDGHRIELVLIEGNYDSVL